MEAKGKPFCKAQRSLQGFAAILKSAACEWFLIFLMLIDALLSYVLTKFAHSCNLQTPCILCSRLDHLLGKEKPNNYRNLLCTNHRLEISSLVSCYKHKKLVDGNEMCDACLCSFATTNNRAKFNSKMQRLIVGKLRSDTGGNGEHGKLLNRDSISHCMKTRPCSCCSKPWKTRPSALGLLQLKSSVNAATKPNIPYPRRLNNRDSLKKMRDKIFGSVTLQHPGKTGFNLLSHVGYSELRITSDSELEDLLSEEDVDKSLICEKSELKEDFVLRSITRIPRKPHCNNCDQVKPSINFVDSRPSPLESYVQVDVLKPHDVKSLACNATFHGLNQLHWLPWSANLTANPSTWAELISLDDASSPASNALGLPHAYSMENSKLPDSLNQESTLSCSPEFITAPHDPQVVGNLTISEETRTDNMEIASLNEVQDHSTLISTKVEEHPEIDEVVNESSSEKVNDDKNHNSDSESSESDTEHTNHNSDSESSKSDKKHTNHNSDSESSKSDKEYKNHNSDSESSESDKEHEGNLATGQPLKKETDVVANDVKQPPLIVEECSKTNEVVCESIIKDTKDDMDHSNVSESSESDKEQEVVNLPLENEIDLGTHDLKQSPLINTTIEECPKTDEVVYVSPNRHTTDDVDHISVSKSFESDNEHEVINFDVGQSSEKETDIVTNDLKQSPLINTSIEECPKSDEVTYESTIKNTNDDMDHSNVSESSESDKEHEIFNSATGPSSEKEIDTVTNDLKQSPLINPTFEEYPKTDEVACESAIKNTNDDMNHESSESDKEQEVFNFATEQSSKKESELVTNDMEHSPLINTTIEKCSTTDEMVYESAIMNTNDDMDHSSVSDTSESDKQQEVFNITIGQPLKTEPEPYIVTNDMEQFSLQNNPTELVNQSSSNDEGHSFSISHDDLQEEFSSEFNIIGAFHRSASMDSDVESLDGSNVSEIEGENIVDRLKRRVEYDKKCIHSLYKELEEERSASEVAASQAMAMITRLQEEKAAMHMEALHYLRMMEEQAEYDVEALEKANELLNERDRAIQDLETELEYYRANYLVDTIVESEHEKSDGANEENSTSENDTVEQHEYNGNYSFKSTGVEASKASYRSLNNQTSSLVFEDEKIYIQLCLKSLEDKINKIFTNGLLARVPNGTDIEEMVNPEQKGEESIDAERSQRNNEENSPSMHIDKKTCNGAVTPEDEFVDPENSSNFGSEENFPDIKGQISCANKRDEVDFLALEHKISDLTGRLDALQADYDFLEHSLNSLRFGEDGLQFAQNIVHQLQELCKLGIRLDRPPGS